MMIAVNSLPGNDVSPAVHILEKCIGVANAAKDENGLRGQFKIRNQNLLIRVHSPIADQMGGCWKNWKLRKFLDRLFQGELILRSGKNNYVSPVDPAEGFSQAAGRKKGFLS